MTKEERELLLTVARFLRAHMNDHMNRDFSYIDQDWTDLNDALRPFDPSRAEPTNESAQNAR